MRPARSPRLFRLLRLHPVALLVGALFLLLAGCEGSGGPGERVRGGGFVLRCDPGCGPGAEALLDALILTRDSVVTWMGGDVREQEAARNRLLSRPLRIRLYASPAAFQRADERLASGRFREQQAFSHARTRSAHILAEGAPDPRRWQRFGPGFQGERLVVHEAAHLVTYTLADDARWPHWVSEGIAAHAEEQWARTALAGPVNGAEVEGPWLHTQRFTRRRLMERGELPSPAEVVRGQLGSLPLGARYATWSLFMGVLLEPPFRDATQELLASLAGTPPRGGWGRGEVVRRFDALFDEETQRAVERAMLRRVQEEAVEWVEIRRSAGWTPEGLLQLPVSRAPFLWRPSPAMEGRAEAGRAGVGRSGAELSGIVLRGEVERLGGGGGAPAGDLILALGRGGIQGEVVGVRIPARGTGEPEPVLLSLRADARPRPLALAVAHPPSPVAPTSASPGPVAPDPQGEAVELRWENGVLTLSVDDLPPWHWVLEGVGPSGGWGVGSTGTEAVLWRRLGVTTRSSAPGP